MGLFDFLKPKDQAAESATRKAGNLFRAQALTTAIARNIPKYLTEVKRGRCKVPACTRRPSDRAGTYATYGKTPG
jgi:hypothetical protein